MTRVLLVNDHLGWNGNVIHGVARLFLQWMPAFDARRYHVIVCVLRKKDSLSEHFEQRGIQVRFLAHGRFSPLTLWSLLKIIREEKIDLMHVQGYGASTFGRLAKILTGTPVVVHFHDDSPYYPWVQRIADFILARFTDAAIAASNRVKRFCSETGRMAGIDITKTVVMPNCVSLNEFQALDPNEILAEKKRLGLSSNSKIVGTVTRLYDSKGNRYVLEAAVQVLEFSPNTTFLIVGDGPLRQDLETLSKRLGIDDRVVFTGFSKDVARLLAIFDVMVFASWKAEGTPLAVLEAMAMGKAIVATDIVEIIEDGVTGLLVPPKDSRAIGRCVISCLTDEDLAKRLGKNAKEESQNYSVDAYVSKLQSIYDQVVQRVKRQTTAPYTTSRPPTG